MTDQAKLNRQPERVRVKTVSQAATLNQVLRGYKIADKRLEEMAILNGMKLTDRVAQGALIKIVQ